jgi:transposase
MEKMIKDLTDEELIEYIKGLQISTAKLEMELEETKAAYEKQQADFGRQQVDYEKLQSNFSQKEQALNKLQQEHLLLTENFEKIRKLIFGQSSEKRRFIEDADQLSFMGKIFNEAEVFAKQATNEELHEVGVSGHIRKPKRTREELLASLPVFEILCDTKEEDRICDACGSGTRYLGKEHVRDEIEIIPQKMHIIRYVRANYVCDECHKTENQARIIKSPVPEPVIKHSLASPSAVAGVIYQKYVNSMPIARQEKDWAYQGVHVNRATLGNWVLKSTREHLFPLYDLMKEELLKASVIAADETDVQVLKEKDKAPSSKSKMWAYRTIGKEETPPVVLFEYQPSRAGSYAASFLKGFSGSLMTDAYAGYNAVTGVNRCYCLAHARRYWHNALPKDKAGSKAKIGLDYVGKLFDMEREWKDLPSSERLLKRNEHAKPVLDEYFVWVESLEALVGSNLGKAVQYSLNNKEGFLGYLKDGRVEISNNKIEGNIRKFVIGRNNFIAVDTVAGARASAVCYSMVITAQENELNVYEYLKYLFQELPKRRKSKDHSILESCLPWSKTLPNECYMKKDSE